MYKKIIILLFILVFGLSVIVSAELTTDEVGVTVNVDKYTAIEYDRDPMEDGLDFLEAEGSTGIYNTNGNSNWENYLQNDIWGDKEWKTHPVHNSDGMRQAIVEMFVAANTEIQIQFEFIEGNDWIESETLFALWNANGNGSGAYSSTTFGKHEDFDKTSSFIQPSSKKREYHLVGGFLIEDITQQKAGDYTAKIQLTVSSVE